MGQYVARRILISVPVLLGITIIAFFVLQLAPGDPLMARMDPAMISKQSEEWVANQRRELGLDQPLPIQYARWLVGVLRGDLGYSVATGESIADQLKMRVPATLHLMGVALAIGIVIGIPFGVISAVRQYSIVDYLLTALTMVLISTPTFFLGMLGIYIFGVYLHVLPTSGMFTLGAPWSAFDRLSHIVLPASILGFGNAALLMRYTRAGMLDVLHREYVTTAKAKGVAPWIVLVRHVLRNALLPVITVVGLLLPELVAGAVIKEQIFAWPGMGHMAVRAAADRDTSLLMGAVLVVGVGVLVSNLLADIAYAAADPRIRFR